MSTINSRKFTALLLLVALPVAGLADDPVGASLERCAQIDDDGARLECFDALAERHKAAAGDSIPAAPAPVRATAPVPLTDEVGKARVEGPDYSDEPRFTAHVVSCRKNPQSGQYVFSFENGQVWKQSAYRSISLRNCDFDVEIQKVSFGYDMYIPSKDRTLRIARVR